jgi:tetratricopeptide (TPR) repeat protein
MSIIYKSLKQVQNKKLERRCRARPASPQAIAPSYQRVLKRFAGQIVLVVVFIGVTIFWLQAEVQRITALTAKQVETSAEALGPEILGPEIRWAVQAQPRPEGLGSEASEQQQAQHQTVVVSAVRPMEQMTPSVELGPAPGLPLLLAADPAKTLAPPPKELASPKLELERHFSAQALRNHELLTLQRAAQFQGQPELVAQEIKQRLGPQSMFTLRLSGYEALKEGDFARAEDFLRQALARNPRDKTTRMNLVLALLGQDKYLEAKQVYERLVQEYPMDEQVARLGQGF